MRKHGWQLPYHPLQVVAAAVFLALGFSFYVFFAPFVGKQLFQYIVMGIYTTLIICVFSLFIWCAAADPADPGVFRSKKYLRICDSKKHVGLNESKLGAESTSSIQDDCAGIPGENAFDKSNISIDKRAECTSESDKKNMPSRQVSCFMSILALLPCAYVCNLDEESSERQMSEDGMFYCSLCEVEVGSLHMKSNGFEVRFVTQLSYNPRPYLKKQ